MSTNTERGVGGGDGGDVSLLLIFKYKNVSHLEVIRTELY